MGKQEGQSNNVGWSLKTQEVNRQNCKITINLYNKIKIAIKNSDCWDLQLVVTPTASLTRVLHSNLNTTQPIFIKIMYKIEQCTNTAVVKIRQLFKNRAVSFGRSIIIKMTKNTLND